MTTRGVIASEEQVAPAVRISIVIPTLNEEKRIAALLEELGRIPGLHEVIVADGESSDLTAAIASGFPRVRLVRSARGRARQMNAGARAASGDVLLFLHADVSLPRDAAQWVQTVLADADVVAGAFRTWTSGEGRRSWVTPLLHLADFRSRYSSLPYGDQAIFVRAEAFRRVGGYADLELMEDLDLSRRLRRLGRIRTVPATVSVSGRRFLAGPLYCAVLVRLLPLIYRLGIPPRLFAGLYGNPR